MLTRIEVSNRTSPDKMLERRKKGEVMADEDSTGSNENDRRRFGIHSLSDRETSEIESSCSVSVFAIGPF